MRPSLTSTILVLSTLASLSSLTTAKKSPKVNASDNNPDDPTGKILYITEPACGFYQCTVTWNIGEEVAVNWLGPPGGNVAVSLMSNIGGPTYVITNSIAGTSQEGYCDAGYGLGVVAPGHECGRVQFVVPSGWEKMDNYTIVVQSLNNPDQIGYTDKITIASPNSSNSNPPSGTSVTLATVAAPTSTNLDASQKPTISVPSPTAVTGQPSSSVASSPSSSVVANSFSASSRRSESSSLSTTSGGSSTISSNSPSAASAGSSPSQTPSSSASTLAVRTGSALLAVALTAMLCLSRLSSVPADSRTHTDPESHQLSSTVYGSAAARTGIKRFEMNEEEMEPRAAARFVSDELLMDGNPSLNLASFVTTFMEPEAEKLMVENLSKNMIDHEEYPAMAELESRCVNHIARLWNAPLDDENSEAMGVSTIGSSEAIMLAVLAAKRRWKIARKEAGKDFSNPNIVMSAAVHCVFEKACNYFEVEPKYWYCTPGKYALDPKDAVELVDENTILLVCILGTTYTGEYEDVETCSTLLDKKCKEENLDVYIHVDGASGAFVAPFVSPELKWDFRLPRVVSINASGHKYGLAYAGVGWVVWRNKDFLPSELIFTVDYLGSPQATFTLNFSKSGVQVVAQYYQFLRLGKSGYRAIMENLTSTAAWLASEVDKIDDGNLFEIMSADSKKGLPLVAWRIKKENVGYDEFAIAGHLRKRGWIVPAYQMAPHAHDLKLLRVVVREDFSRSRAEVFVRDLQDAVHYLESAPKEVQQHMSKDNGKDKKENPHHPANHSKKQHVHSDEKHSLRGSHGKTHAIC
ncbi:hypothetical protein JCM5353_007717 [Sporobolomyces roseus]